MMFQKLLVLVPLVLVVVAVLGLALLGFLSRRGGKHGLVNGRLLPCPESPNCVCSQAEHASDHVEAIAFSGSAEQALESLKAALASLPRTRIADESPQYLHAECRTALFGFVDDLECLVDLEHRVIHVRSASRVGRSDLGANRRRVEMLRQTFQKVQSNQGR